MDGAEVDYETLRQQNIARNKAVLAALGLDQNDFDLHHKHKHKKSKRGGAKDEEQQQQEEKKKRKIVQTTPTAPSRKSARLQGVPGPDLPSMPATEFRGRYYSREYDDDDDHRPFCKFGKDCYRTSEEHLAEFRHYDEKATVSKRAAGAGGWAEVSDKSEQHQAAAEEYLRDKTDKDSVVGTASYDHTLMRVMTMSTKALGTRIKVIERAKGKHAIVKMRLFAQVLCLEGHDDLAADATAALERLIERNGGH